MIRASQIDGGRIGLVFSNALWYNGGMPRHKSLQLMNVVSTDLSWIEKPCPTGGRQGYSVRVDGLECGHTVTVRGRWSQNQRSKRECPLCLGPRQCKADGCTKNAASLGLCTTHVGRLKRAGSPYIARPRNLTPEELRTQFWSRVIDGDGCWIWNGPKTTYGYGRIYNAGVFIFAHRYSWELAHGPIPDGLIVCHHCDNPPCVRPDHLFLGTHRDNTLDAMAKGRRPVAKKSNHSR